MPDFPSPYFDMRYWLFLEQTSWRRKGSNGRSTEGLPLRHSRRYVVSTEHHSSPNPEYRRQKNNKLVWDETIQIMVDLFDNVWGDRSEVVVDHCLEITLPVRS